MKAGPEWPRPRRQAGLINVVVILLLTNLILLMVLLAADIRLSQSLWWPARTSSKSLTDICSKSTSSRQDDVYPVTLNTRSLDTSRGEVRTLRPHGIASHLIIEFGAYRNGHSTFSIVAMISKRLHDLHEPPYSCDWHSGNKTVTANNVWPIKPDWGLGTMYGTMVVVCTFPEEVGTAGEGGSLVLRVGYADEYRIPETLVALTEKPGEYNASRWAPPFPYDITFCVSRLYGEVNPQRIREWMAYHARLFGNRTLFLFHDAGGLSADVYRILRPWIDLGRVSVQNLRLLNVYQGGKHHQFTILNDCMFRAQTLSNWTFFFDLDEYLYLPPSTSLQEILADSELKNVTQIRMKTMKMSDALCTADITVNDTIRDAQNARKWSFEKLVFANCDYGWKPEESRKYALQPREAWATGVHYCEHLKRGEILDADEKTLRLYHYHGSINVKGEVCRDFTDGPNGEPNYLGIKNCTIDRTLTKIAKQVQRFERAAIGKHHLYSRNLAG